MEEAMTYKTYQIARICDRFRIVRVDSNGRLAESLFKPVLEGFAGNLTTVQHALDCAGTSRDLNSQQWWLNAAYRALLNMS
jgi:hypothetical protein